MMVHPPRKVSGGAEVLITYGGPAAPYAIYVHEITTNQHTPPTQAKFLETARIVNAKPVSEGSTDTWRLTLESEGFVHDASFQYVDERAVKKDLGDGKYEVNFVDSYRYNIAAYRLAELLGMADMVPVSVERDWQGKIGALTWWVDDVWMNEQELIERSLKAPDPNLWSEQIFKVRLFGQLVFDTDRNRGNLLVTRDWHLWMIDFSRAFRRWRKLENTAGLERCSRDVLERLRMLSLEELSRTMEEYLTDNEIDSVLGRRDLLVEHYEQLIRDRGEHTVLY